jgi:hypothetical protein
MSPAFRPHGDYAAWVEGRLVISEVTGPWNVELVRLWAAELHAKTAPLAATGPHAGIAIIHGSMLCPPDALELMAKAVRYPERHLRCVAHVVVADASVEGRELMRASYARMYPGAMPHRLFDDVAEARTWALARLAAA